MAVDELNRLGSLELDLAGVDRGPLGGKAPSVAVASLRGAPGANELPELVIPCPGFFETAPTKLGASFGVREGGEDTGKPGICGLEEVVMEVEFVAVVAVPVVELAIGLRMIASTPVTEFDGLDAVVAGSSGRREERMEVESRLSLADILAGGGIMILALSNIGFIGSDCAYEPFLVGNSDTFVAARSE